MDFDSIDWDLLWREDSRRSNGNDAESQKERWDKRAGRFEKRSGEERDKRDYISQMLDRIEVEPGWSVLDIGSGPGTLAVPLAKKAASVTALDISLEMLKHLQAKAEESDLVNIRCVNASWQEAFAEGRIADHDVVVASRSLMSGSMKEVVTRIQEIARQAVYLTFPVVHLPFDWEVYRAIGRDKKKHPPFIYIYNMLFQMGILANVEILYSKVKVRFSSIEETIEDLQWRTDPFTQQELARLREYLKQKFADTGETGELTHEGNSVWALIWWRKEHSGKAAASC